MEIQIYFDKFNLQSIKQINVSSLYRTLHPVIYQTTLVSNTNNYQLRSQPIPNHAFLVLENQHLLFLSTLYLNYLLWTIKRIR